MTDTQRPVRVPRTAPGVPTDLPSPVAARLRRPGWRDPRLLVGLTLVGGSVLLGSWVLGDAARTTPVLVAREALVAGDRITPEVVETQEVRLPDVDRYLSPEDLDDAVLVRTVGPGELVPRAAVAASPDLGVRAVGVPVDRVAPGVRAGALVDLWFVPRAEPGDGKADAPRTLATELVVADVQQDRSAFAVDQGAVVHVLVPPDGMADVLGALAGGGSVAVVAVAGGAG